MKKNLKKNQIIDPKNILDFFNKLKKGNILIDEKTCSLYFEK